MKILKKINEYLSGYKSLIETIGIIGGICLLLLTFNSTNLTKKSLELALKQDVDNQLPVWDWEIHDSLSFVTLHSTNSNIKIQMADAYFPQEIFKDGAEWPLNQPDFKLHLTVFKNRISSIIQQYQQYDNKLNVIRDREVFPFGLEINYVQYGTARSVKGVFAVQFTMIRSDEVPKIIINGILFNYYLDNEENLKEIIDRLYVQ